ncbi:MAG: MFS transporter [Planctomycetes bacterium]|nr:MFS transporter [Planctomycetota bacterium]
MHLQPATEPPPSVPGALRRKALFALLYLSEGAPIGFLWWALPTRLREGGVPLAEITALSALLAIPWTLKFLWAPLLDTLRGPGWGYRSWLLLAQTIMGLALIPLAWLDLPTHLGLVTALCLTHAFAAATQDVAIDALAVATTAPEERGALNGWMQVGMLTGRSLFGGGVLWAGAFLGQGVVVVALCLLLAGVGTTIRRCDLHEPAPPAATGASEAGFARRALAVLAAFLRSLRAAVFRWRIAAGLAFALVAGCGFEATAGVVGPFLIDLGYGSDTVGAFQALPAVVLMAGGALCGGALADRWGKARLVGWALALLAAATGWVGLTPPAVAGGSVSTAALYLGPFYAAVGVFTASSYALFMDQTEPAVAATQFTAFMALTNACESWAVFSVGRLIPAWGYGPSFGFMALVSLGALPLLLLLWSRPAAATADGSLGETSPAGIVRP